MEQRQGWFTNDQEKFLADLLDEKVQLKGVLEMADGMIFKLVISTLDNNLIEKIPDEWNNPIAPIIDAVIAKDWDQAAVLIASFADDKIDIPGIDDLSEKMIFSSVLALAAGIIQSKVEREIRKRDS